MFRQTWDILGHSTRHVLLLAQSVGFTKCLLFKSRVGEARGIYFPGHSTGDETSIPSDF